MKGWINNLIQYEKNNHSGKCPYCDSSRVEVEETFFGRRSVTFRCKQCGKSEHFDGISEEIQKES